MIGRVVAFRGGREGGKKKGEGKGEDEGKEGRRRIGAITLHR
jgi:hypothetical protein